MTEELYKAFANKVWPLLKEKKFPTEDVCRSFNILVRISAYHPVTKDQKEDKNLKFILDLVGRLRHSIYDIPKEYFTLTMANLIEYQ